MRRVPGGARILSLSGARPDACASRWLKVAPGGPAGSSQAVVPSSTAIQTASAVSTLVTDAQANERSPGPTVSPGPASGPATLAAATAAQSVTASSGPVTP